MHGREHILAVLVEGEPVDSFPDILRFEEREVTDAEGNVHIEKIEVEPLAADVRGKDKKEVLKQIKSELLRLVAPILGCNYDAIRTAFCFFKWNRLFSPKESCCLYKTIDFIGHIRIHAVKSAGGMCGTDDIPSIYFAKTDGSKYDR